MSTKHNNDSPISTNTTIEGGGRKSLSESMAAQATGRWTPEEHQAFLEGLKIFGREWKKVAECIPTRTSAQIRSHAQKYFAKLAKEESLLLIQEQGHGASSHQPPGMLGSEVTDQTGVVDTESAVTNPSVQKTVERILADPVAAQREVEDTLEQLRDRYRQLQIRLEENNRQQNLLSQRERLPNRIVEEVERDDAQEMAILSDRTGNDEDNDNDRQNRAQSNMQFVVGRKRSLETIQPNPGRNQSDEVSSISSTLSSISRSRELGSEEIIALHVLGGSMSRSSSQQQLEHAIGFEDTTVPAEHGGPGGAASVASGTSSLTSAIEAAVEGTDGETDGFTKRLKVSDTEVLSPQNRTAGAGTRTGAILDTAPESNTEPRGSRLPL